MKIILNLKQNLNLNNMTPQDKIQSKLAFIESVTAYDFTKYMSQYALEVNYTNGDKDMFTTPMDPTKGNDKGDFKSVEEFNECIGYCQSKGLLRS